MKIQNCEPEDINQIFRLYRLASSFQKEKNATAWPEYEHYLIEIEIAENRQWKLLINNEIACVWAIIFSDAQFWAH
jgi:hypothetical protein